MNRGKNTGSPKPVQRPVRIEAWVKPTNVSFSKQEPTTVTLQSENPPYDSEKSPPDWGAAQLHAVRCK